MLKFLYCLKIFNYLNTLSGGPVMRSGFWSAKSFESCTQMIKMSMQHITMRTSVVDSNPLRSGKNESAKV